MDLLNVGLVILLSFALQIDGQRVPGDTEITDKYNSNPNIAASIDNATFLSFQFQVNAKLQSEEQNGTFQVIEISGLNKVVEAYLYSSDVVDYITLAQFKNITLSGLCFGDGFVDSVDCSFSLQTTNYKGQRVVDGNVVTGELLSVQGLDFPNNFPKVPDIRATADEVKNGVFQTVNTKLQDRDFSIIPDVVDAINNSFKTYFATQS